MKNFMKVLGALAVLLIIVVVGLLVFVATKSNVTEQQFNPDVMSQETVVDQTSEPTEKPMEEPVVEVTVAPTPMPTEKPVEEPVGMLDQELAKFFYQCSDSTKLEEYVRENVSASEAVDGVRCDAIHASYAVSCEDEAVESALLTAYELLTEEDDEFVFFRHKNKLFGYDPAKEFEVKEEAVEFSGIASKKARQAWFCEEHNAIRGQAMFFVGYPNAENALGDFRISNGFAEEILKSVRLIKTGEDRYDWVLVYCECEIKSTAGHSGNNSVTPTVKPTVEPTKQPELEPTEAPDVEPTVQPTEKPTVEPTVAPENNPRPTALPTPKPEEPENNPRPTALPTPKPEESDSMEESDTGSGNVSTDDNPFEADSETDNESSTIENNGRPSMSATDEDSQEENDDTSENLEEDSQTGNEESESSARPSMSTESSEDENTGSGTVSTDPNPFE